MFIIVKYKRIEHDFFFRCPNIIIFSPNFLLPIKWPIKDRRQKKLKQQKHYLKGKRILKILKNERVISVPYPIMIWTCNLLFKRVIKVLLHYKLLDYISTTYMPKSCNLIHISFRQLHQFLPFQIMMINDENVVEFGKWGNKYANL